MAEDNDSNSSVGGVDDHLTKNLDGMYDAKKFELPDAPSRVKNLFAFISHYSPQMIEIGFRLKPFLPDNVPTVGNVDAFIKIPYPDNRSNQLGLIVLDEPSTQQSDTTLLEMTLRTFSHETNRSDSFIQSAQTAFESSNVFVAKNNREIEKWIDNIQLLHEAAVRPESFALIHQKPDHESIVSLMQEWPEQFENVLDVHAIPNSQLDCSLEEYINIFAAILDIPVQNNKIAALYLIFSLLNEFQNSQHFSKLPTHQ
ncbi:intraflagellar transport protein 46-like protein [Sarcoptes scabiei]|uniref:Intraflagellar transport protein 46 homolog n=1 Tax=Sarcoptes scabiei TaxID=52283 RepID=A0A132AM22_SARSC|nr:intraflagellar transport protein 46-like protein [Sarcoptes scabiei]